MTEVSATRLYLGNLPRNGEIAYLDPFKATGSAKTKPWSWCDWMSHIRPERLLETGLTISPVTKADIEKHFGTHGTGTIREIKLMQGFGFIEYEDAMDARDVVPGKFVGAVGAHVNGRLQR